MPTEPQILSEEAVQEIEGRAEKATEGPWEIRASTLPPYNVGVICQYESHDCLFIPDSAGAMIDSVEMIANLQFASHARTDVPALCQTVRALRAESAEWEKQARLNQKAYGETLARLSEVEKERDTAQAFVTRLTIEKQRLERENERLHEERAGIYRVP